MKFEHVKIAELKPLPKNARKHSKRNLDVIKKSLETCGQQKPIVVDDKNVVLAGNGTLAAAKSLGWNEIWVARTDLDKSKADLFAILDNRAAELAEWDMIELTECLDDLESQGWDLKPFGWDDSERGKMRPEEVKPGLTDDDAVPENVETRCKLGDLWALGTHRVLCGDSTDVLCVERLMNGEKAETFFVDPPYGDNVGGLRTKTADEKKKSLGKSAVKRSSFIKNDDRIDWLQDVFNLVPGFLLEKSTKMVFFQWRKYSEILAMASIFGDPSALCVWDRVRRANNFFRFQPQHELLLHWGSQEDKKEPLSLANVWHIPKESENKELHPTVKPISILEPAIRVTTSLKAIVLDLFLGSGSTLIACEKTNRTCYGMELDPKYCDVIIKRWEDFTGKKATLDAGNSEG